MCARSRKTLRKGLTGFVGAVYGASILGLVLLGLGSLPAAAQGNAIEGWAAERDTNFFNLPEAWRLTQPVTLRISFSLKAEPGSAEAADFIQALKQNVGTLPYANSFKVEPVVVPAKYDYATTFEFDNLAQWRAHETSQELLDFVFSRWVNDVDESEEMVTIAPKED